MTLTPEQLRALVEQAEGFKGELLRLIMVEQDVRTAVVLSEARDFVGSAHVTLALLEVAQLTKRESGL